MSNAVFEALNQYSTDGSGVLKLSYADAPEDVDAMYVFITSGRPPTKLDPHTEILAGYLCETCEEEMSKSWGKECPICGNEMRRVFRSKPWPEAV